MASITDIAGIAEIAKKVSGNKELMAQIANADPKQAKEILKKANFDVSEEDIKVIQKAAADGKFDLKEIKEIAEALLKK